MGTECVRSLVFPALAWAAFWTVVVCSLAPSGAAPIPPPADEHIVHRPGGAGGLSRDAGGSYGSIRLFDDPVEEDIAPASTRPLPSVDICDGCGPDSLPSVDRTDRTQAPLSPLPNHDALEAATSCIFLVIAIAACCILCGRCGCCARD